jgi:hypothetical protein
VSGVAKTARVTGARARRVAGGLAVAVVIATSPVSALAQAPPAIRVLVEFRQSVTGSREAVEGRGRGVITERGGARPGARLGVEDTRTRTRQSTGIFTIVQSGGESTLTVATRVPTPQIAFYRDYATGAGYVAAGVAFTEVGTSLRTSATALPGNQVRVRLTPTISYLSPAGSGAIEFTEASTELVVPSGRPVVLGGAATRTHALTRHLLGLGEEQSESQTTVVLTATVQ